VLGFCAHNGSDAAKLQYKYENGNVVGSCEGKKVSEVATVCSNKLLKGSKKALAHAQMQR
jgi:hypothetical protein